MHISQEGVALIKKFEGCELEAYVCPVSYTHLTLPTIYSV